MYQGKRVGALLLMAGEGRRFESELPKQFHLLGTQKVYLHTLSTLLQTALFDEILLISPPSFLSLVQAETAHFPTVRAIPGGPTRQLSSYQGLTHFQTPPDLVLIHDAVRPFVSPAILLENIQQALHHPAVNTCIPSNDTLVFTPDPNTLSIPPRHHFLRGQTPQTFHYPTLLLAHQNALKNNLTDATDDCRLVLDLGQKIHIIPGSEANFKITSQQDLLLASLIIKI